MARRAHGAETARARPRPRGRCHRARTPRRRWRHPTIPSLTTVSASRRPPPPLGESHAPTRRTPRRARARVPPRWRGVPRDGPARIRSSASLRSARVMRAQPAHVLRMTPSRVVTAAIGMRNERDAHAALLVRREAHSATSSAATTGQSQRTSVPRPGVDRRRGHGAPRSHEARTRRPFGCARQHAAHGCRARQRARPECAVILDGRRSSLHPPPPRVVVTHLHHAPVSFGARRHRRHSAAAFQHHRVGAQAGERAQRQRLARHHRAAARRPRRRAARGPGRATGAPARLHRPAPRHRRRARTARLPRRRVPPAVSEQHDDVERDGSSSASLKPGPAAACRASRAGGPCVTTAPGATERRADTVHPLSSSAAIDELGLPPRARRAAARATAAYRAARPPGRCRPRTRPSEARAPGMSAAAAPHPAAPRCR